MSDRTEAQTICDVLMMCLSKVHARQCPEDREAMFDWVRRGLAEHGIAGRPRGLLHFVHEPKPEPPNPLVDEVQFLNATLSGMEQRAKALGEVIKAQTAALALFTERPHIVTGLNRNG